MSSFQYTSEVQYNEETDEYYLTFSDELLEEMDWKEGDTLEFEFFEHHDSPGIRIHKVGE
jgi:hypothetical protein